MKSEGSSIWIDKSLVGQNEWLLNWKGSRALKPAARRDFVSITFQNNLGCLFKKAEMGNILQMYNNALLWHPIIVFTMRAKHERNWCRRKFRCDSFLTDEVSWMDGGIFPAWIVTKYCEISVYFV